MPYQDKGHGRRSRSDKKHNGHHGGGKYKNIGDKAREALENIDSNSPVMKCFQQYASELDYKHDKYERIVKSSRDITIESKRIIFLLHTLDRDSKREAILTEAATRLSQIVNTHLKNIAAELKGEDPFQYLRAYTAGLQEYVEAMTFHHYLMSNSLQDWKSIQKDLSFKMEDTVTENDSESAKTETESSIVRNDDGEISLSGDKNVSLITAHITPMDYILGVADLTGELMRKCINNLGSGNIEGCYQTCTFVRDIYSGFLGISCTGYKEISRKIVTLRQSLYKMENACYTIHVRGSEIPKHMLADVFTGTQDDFVEEDEGFY